MQTLRSGFSSPPRSCGATVTTPDLYEAVWKERFLPGSGNTVMVHVLNLRRKIEENPSSPRILRTDTAAVALFAVLGAVGAPFMV